LQPQAAPPAIGLLRLLDASNNEAFGTFGYSIPKGDSVKYVGFFNEGTPSKTTADLELVPTP
jgi:hypothetical protein